VEYLGGISVGDAAYSMTQLMRLSRPIQKGIVTDWDDMERVWSHTLYNELRIDPKEHPILLTEAPLNPKAEREHTIQIMFETMGTPAVYLTTAAVLSLYATHRTSGIVLDAGADATHAVPVYELQIVPHAVQCLDLGGRQLTEYMERLLMEERGIRYSTAGKQTSKPSSVHFANCNVT
jgi:actin